MRLGVVLAAPWLRDAARLDALGYDLAWISEAEAPAPLVVAGALAPVTRGLRIAACVRAGAHPVAVAEDAAAADLVLGGRLVLALEGDEAPLLTETFEVLQLAFAARPFAHTGARWRIPARLPEHVGIPPRLRVTPTPAQLELPVWLAGPAAPLAAETCLTTFLADSGLQAAAEAWSRLERLGGLGAHRLRRVLRFAVTVSEQGTVDVAELVGELRAHRDAWGLDVAILALPAMLPRPARERALEEVARFVRPRLQLEALPPGLEDSWNVDPEEAVP
jgi:alkanesulfonate monooxygenase SsuD/methylene tetrahydromethanopterin reductase-like flavin-dependent oxidoreductase (luciferase family)